MSERGRTLEIHTSPHLASGASVDDIMRNVVLALLPVAAFAIYSFGLAAALVLAVAVLSCVATEHLLCRLVAAPTTLRDWSVTIT
ncbi:MAG: RnfABCDGE type electron transport complex subunit D, partial [Halioglobus sp.]|nr:RnfABCDGE type electron transport complex subunit D [Halioglobus sp.]